VRRRHPGDLGGQRRGDEVVHQAADPRQAAEVGPAVVGGHVGDAHVLGGVGGDVGRGHDRGVGPGAADVLPPVVAVLGGVAGRLDPRRHRHGRAREHVGQVPGHHRDQVEVAAGGRGDLVAQAGLALLGQQVPALELDPERHVDAAVGLGLQPHVGEGLGLAHEGVAGPALVGVPHVADEVEGAHHLHLDGGAEHGVQREEIGGRQPLDRGLRAEVAGQGAQRVDHAPAQRRARIVGRGCRPRRWQRRGSWRCHEDPRPARRRVTAR
jgi:hypothetical protein